MVEKNNSESIKEKFQQIKQRWPLRRSVGCIYIPLLALTMATLIYTGAKNSTPTSSPQPEASRWAVLHPLEGYLFEQDENNSYSVRITAQSTKNSNKALLKGFDALQWVCQPYNLYEETNPPALIIQTDKSNCTDNLIKEIARAAKTNGVTDEVVVYQKSTP